MTAVGASLLAMVVNDDAGCLNARVVWSTIASRLAPAVDWVHPRNQVVHEAAIAGKPRSHRIGI